MGWAVRQHCGWPLAQQRTRGPGMPQAAPCVSVPARVCLCRPVCVCTAQCVSVPARVCLCRPVCVCATLCVSVPPCVCLCQPVCVCAAPCLCVVKPPGLTLPRPLPPPPTRVCSLYNPCNPSGTWGLQLTNPMHVCIARHLLVEFIKQHHAGLCTDAFHICFALVGPVLVCARVCVCVWLCVHARNCMRQPAPARANPSCVG